MCVWNLRQTEVCIKHTVLVKKYITFHFKQLQTFIGSLSRTHARNSWSFFGVRNLGLVWVSDFRQRDGVCACVSPWLRGSSPRSCQEAGSKSCHPDTQTPGPDKRLPSPSPRAEAITSQPTHTNARTPHGQTNKRLKNTQIWTVQGINSQLKHTENHSSHSVIYIYKI